MAASNKKLVREFVARAVMIRNRRVLLVNKIGESHYFLPGGRLEAGESIEQCLVREIHEELNRSCRILEYVGSIEHLFEDKNKTQYEVNFFFTVDMPRLDTSQSPKAFERELRFCWVEISKLAELDLRPKPVLELIKTIFRRKKAQPFWASTLTASSLHNAKDY